MHVFWIYHLYTLLLRLTIAFNPALEAIRKDENSTDEDKDGGDDSSDDSDL